MLNAETARRSMIDGQLRPNKVSEERVLSAMEAVPREDFVPVAARAVAYLDSNLPLGHGRHVLDPMVFARMIQALNIQPTDRALEIGSGTGYGAAVLAHLAASVVAVEEVLDLASAASGHVHKLGLLNVAVVTSPLAAGYSTQAPYDVILIEGGVHEISSAVLGQLADGGRLVAVQLGKGAVGQVTLWQRVGEVISSRVLFDAAVPLLAAFARQPGFRF